MDREILFRGKRLDNGGWVQGSLISFGDGGKAILPSKSDVFQRAGYKFLATMDCYEVDSSSVGQYTGLTDKNGVKIFKGDIVKTSKYGKDDGAGHNFSGPDTFTVGFEDGGYCLRNKWRRFNLRPDVDIEVIGNIHDNPELIGGEDDG